jgi:hypothetical protein
MYFNSTTILTVLLLLLFLLFVMIKFLLHFQLINIFNENIQYLIDNDDIEDDVDDNV